MKTLPFIMLLSLLGRFFVPIQILLSIWYSLHSLPSFTRDLVSLASFYYSSPSPSMTVPSKREVPVELVFSMSWMNLALISWIFCCLVESSQDCKWEISLLWNSFLLSIDSSVKLLLWLRMIDKPRLSYSYILFIQDFPYINTPQVYSPSYYYECCCESILSLLLSSCTSVFTNPPIFTF